VHGVKCACVLCLCGVCGVVCPYTVCAHTVSMMWCARMVCTVCAHTVCMMWCARMVCTVCAHMVWCGRMVCTVCWCVQVPGEDPFLSGEYANYYVTGCQQGPDPRYLKMSAGLKHFSAFSDQYLRGWRAVVNLWLWRCECSVLRVPC
jgi:hypothetical protein